MLRPLKPFSDGQNQPKFDIGSSEVKCSEHCTVVETVRLHLQKRFHLQKCSDACTSGESQAYRAYRLTAADKMILVDKTLVFNGEDPHTGNARGEYIHVQSEWAEIATTFTVGHKHWRSPRPQPPQKRWRRSNDSLKIFCESPLGLHSKHSQGSGKAKHWERRRENVFVIASLGSRWPHSAFLPNGTIRHPIPRFHSTRRAKLRPLTSYIKKR